LLRPSCIGSPLLIYCSVKPWFSAMHGAMASSNSLLTKGTASSHTKPKRKKGWSAPTALSPRLEVNWELVHLNPVVLNYGGGSLSNIVLQRPSHTRWPAHYSQLYSSTPSDDHIHGSLIGFSHAQRDSGKEARNQNLIKLWTQHAHTSRAANAAKQWTRYQRRP
jgi:hypothetical protein